MSIPAISDIFRDGYRYNDVYHQDTDAFKGTGSVRHQAILLSLILLAFAAGVRAGGPADDAGRGGDLGFPDLSWGFKAGLSLGMNSGVMERDAEFSVSSDYRRGFAGGLFLSLPVTSRFALQQEVLYVQKGSRQDITVEILDIPTVLDVTYDMDYIEIPVLISYTWFRRGGRSFYSLAGTALSLKVTDRYKISGVIDDGVEQVPMYADSDMSEVEMFDYSFIFGFGYGHEVLNRRLLIEYRFTIGWNGLEMPTYVYIPFEGDDLLIDNEPVTLKNQSHLILFGLAF